MYAEERKGAPVDYNEIRAAVLLGLKEEGPMIADDIVLYVLNREIGNEGAIKRAIKYLKEDGKITRTKTHEPWRLA